MSDDLLPDSPPRYSYLVTNVLSGQIIGELPIRGCTYGMKLNDVGAMSASISWNPTTRSMGLKQNTKPGARGIYVFRDSQLVWGGIIWKRKFTRKASGNTVPTVGIECETFESYLFRRFQHITRFFGSTDQIDIARWLVAQLGDLPNGTLNIAVDAITTSTRLRDRTFFDYEFKTIGEELAQLAALIDGFDYAIKPYQLSDGYMRQTLNFGYPMLGQSITNTALYFEYPTNISEFTTSEDAAAAATHEYAIGAGDGEDQLQSLSVDVAGLQVGYPALEKSHSYKSVYSPITLQQHSDADLIEDIAPVTLLDVTVRGDADPVVGTYSPGDYARIHIDDDWFSTAFDDYYRIGEIAVTVPDTSVAESVKLTFDTGNDHTQDDGTVSEDDSA